MLKVLGDHRKKKVDGDSFKVGIMLYTRGTKNKTSFKKDEQWWLVEAADIIWKLSQPVQEKITDK